MRDSFGCKVQRAGFRVQGLGVGVEGRTDSGFRGARIYGSGFRGARLSGCRVGTHGFSEDSVNLSVEERQRLAGLLLLHPFQVVLLETY